MRLKVEEMGMFGMWCEEIGMVGMKIKKWGEMEVVVCMGLYASGK